MILKRQQKRHKLIYFFIVLFLHMGCNENGSSSSTDSIDGHNVHATDTADGAELNHRDIDAVNYFLDEAVATVKDETLADSAPPAYSRTTKGPSFGEKPLSREGELPGHKSHLSCDKGILSCDDKNPCTLDFCNDNGECEHKLDPSKSDFGSCDMDGNFCTTGKCIINTQDGAIICHEQPREFLPGEAGCNDGDQCTSDSCIETPLYGQKRKISNDDEDQNIRLDKGYICVHELQDGAPCFDDDQCRPGKCMILNTGGDKEEFSISCVANTTGQPEAFCPDLDTNPCTFAVCEPQVGCTIKRLPDQEPCDDGDPCTLGDKCQTDPMTADFICFGTPKIDVSQNMGGCSDEDLCTKDTCSNGVCVNSGPIQCFDTDNNVCTPEMCNPSSGLCESQQAVSGSCDDADPCTIDDMCQTNPMTNTIMCFGTPKIDVPQNMGGCSDENLCTNDTCSKGVCAHSAPIVCPQDLNFCTIEECIPSMGCITRDRTMEDGLSCNDFNVCTVLDMCQKEDENSPSTCQGIPKCDDEDLCTIDRCFGDGSCESIPKVQVSVEDGGCLTNNPCEKNSCDSATGNCLLPEILICNDNNPCTNDTCAKTHCLFEPIDGLGPTCDTGIPGQCSEGFTICMNGIKTGCTSFVQPQPEVCGNAKDDDCDGLTDCLDYDDCCPPDDVPCTIRSCQLNNTLCVQNNLVYCESFDPEQTCEIDSDCPTDKNNECGTAQCIDGFCVGIVDVGASCTATPEDPECSSTDGICVRTEGGTHFGKCAVTPINEGGVCGDYPDAACNGLRCVSGTCLLVPLNSGNPCEDCGICQEGLCEGIYDSKCPTSGPDNCMRGLCLADGTCGTPEPVDSLCPVQGGDVCTFCCSNGTCESSSQIGCTFDSVCIN